MWLQLVTVLCMLFLNCNRCDAQKLHSFDTAFTLQMDLSAFGVESDDFPNINAFIDFLADTGFAFRSYFDYKKHPSTTFHFSKSEIQEIRDLLQKEDLSKLHEEYSFDECTDLPKSVTIINSSSQTYTVNDYGLIGDPPLQGLYDAVYRLGLPKGESSIYELYKKSHK